MPYESHHHSYFAKERLEYRGVKLLTQKAMNFTILNPTLAVVVCLLHTLMVAMFYL